MHACGHDTHMAAFIGTARVLAKLKDQWHGTIVFVAQPAEEIGNGARALLKDGLYEKFGKPNFALGFHDKADLETGHIGVTEGYTSRMSIQSMSPSVAWADTAPTRTRQRTRSFSRRKSLTPGKPSQAGKIIHSIRLCHSGLDSRRNEAQHHSGRRETAAHSAYLQI